MHLTNRPSHSEAKQLLPRRGGASLRKSWFFLGLGAALLVVAFIVGYVYWFELTFTLPTARTQHGQFFERLIPENASFVASFNPTHSKERANFAGIWDTLLQDKKNAFVPFVFSSAMKKGGFQIQPEDLMDLADKNLTFTVARLPSQLGTPEQAASDENRSDFIFLFSGQDIVSHIEPLLAKVSTPMSAGIIGDIAYIATSAEAGRKIIDLSNSKAPSLASAKLFREAIKNAAAPFSGYVFFTAAKPIERSLTLIRAYPYGLGFEAASTLNKSAPPDKLPAYEPYLYKKLPAQDALLYIESHHAGALLGSYINNRAKILGTDLSPFLKRGFSLLVQRTATLLPNLSLYIDASSGANEAAIFLKKLDEQKAVWAELGKNVLKSKDKTLPVFEVTKNPRFLEGSSLVIHTDRISPDSSRLPILWIMPEGIRISYGLTQDHVLFISTLPDIEQSFVRRRLLAEGDFFKRATQQIAPDGSLLMLDMDEVFRYADATVQKLKDHNVFTEENQRAYDILKKHLSPIAGFIQSSHGEGVQIQTRGALLIKPTQQ